MKKVIDFVCGLAFLAALVSVFAFGGGYENGTLTAGQTLVRSGISLVVFVGIGALNSILMKHIK